MQDPPSGPWLYTVSCPSVPSAAPDTSGLPAMTQASLARYLHPHAHVHWSSWPVEHQHLDTPGEHCACTGVQNTHHRVGALSLASTMMSYCRTRSRALHGVRPSLCASTCGILVLSISLRAETAGPQGWIDRHRSTMRMHRCGGAMRWRSSAGTCMLLFMARAAAAAESALWRPTDASECATCLWMLLSSTASLSTTQYDACDACNL